MATHQSKAQKETVSRVMHEFKHGELESSSRRKVRNPKQAIAIGLHEAGASKYESKKKNRENLKRPRRANDTVQPRRIGASDPMTSSRGQSSTRRQSGEAFQDVRR